MASTRHLLRADRFVRLRHVDEDALGISREGSKGRLQPQPRKGDHAVHDADAQPPDELSMIAAEARLERINVREQLFCGLIGGAAEIGQSEPAAAPLAELATDHALKRGEVGRQRRGR